jgi:hypothetical protein
MILPSLQTAERLAKSQIPYHVHGEKIQPVRHIYQSSFLQAVRCNRKLMELGNEYVCMIMDQRMLGSKSDLGEGVAQETADAGMEFGVAGRDEVVGLIIWC